MDRSTNRLPRIDAEERAALAADYRAHGPWLRAMASRKLGRADDAEDLVQEAYVRAARYPASARAAAGPLLARILSNLIRDRFRSRARERTAHAAVASVADVSIEGDQEQTLVLKRLILGMPEPLRDVFLLARFSHLTQAQIADRLDVSVKTVEWRMAKALAYCVTELGK